jgi:hypothetical protein
MNGNPIVKLPAPIPKKEEPKVSEMHKNEEEDEIVDVGIPEQPSAIGKFSKRSKFINSLISAHHITPPSSAPPKINGPSFSIAEILHSSSQGQLDEFQQRTLTPLSIPLAVTQADTVGSSSRSSTDNSFTDSQPVLDSQILRHSPSLQRPDGQSAKQRMAQRKKHVEFHR